MIKKKFISTVCFALSFLLSACDNQFAENENQILQDVTNYYYQKADNSVPQICFYLGDIEFPYQTKTVSHLDNKKSSVWINNELNRRLVLFSNIGLIRSIDTNEPKSFELTELGKDYFLNGQFCFGQIEFKRVTFDIDSKSPKINPQAVITYKIVNIPDWAQNKDLTDYFYRHHNKNDYNRYPKINNQSNQFTLSLLQGKEERYFIKNQHEIFKNLFNCQFKHQNSCFAFYDANIAIKLIRQAKDDNSIPPTWGDADPIITAKEQIRPYIARANNLILFPPLDVVHLLSKNKIQSIDIQDRYGDIKVHETFTFAEDGSLDSASFIYKTKKGSMETQITKAIYPNKEQLLWRSQELFKINQPSEYGNLLEKYSVFNFKTLHYDTDLTKQIISVHPEFNEGPDIVITPVFNEQKQLTSFDGKQWEYNKNGLLAKVTVPEIKKVIKLTYDESEKLIQADYYQIETDGLSLISTYLYDDFNQFGDWTKSSCDGKEVTRTIQYYK